MTRQAWTVVNFNLMLEVASSVKRQDPLWIADENSMRITLYTYMSTVRTTTPRMIRSKYQKKILTKYLENYSSFHGINPPKLSDHYHEYARAACAAFKAVFGHTFKSASRLIRGKTYASLSEGSKYLLYYHLYAMKAQTALRCEAGSKEVIEELKEENETLLWACLCFLFYIHRDRESFKVLKERLKEKGLTNGGWKFLCKQSKNWVLTASRYNISLFVFFCNNKIRYSLMKNNFFSTLMERVSIHEIKDVVNLFLKDFHESNEPMSRWCPFPIRKVRGHYQCRELQEIIDYAFHRDGAITEKKVHTLYRNAQRWHEEQLITKIAESDKKEYEKPPCVEERETISGVEFQWISNTTELVKEGIKMHHCVASYNNKCGDGRYQVWHVTGPDGEEATLGVNWGNTPYFNQCYGYCNSYVSQEIIDAVGNLINELIVRKARDESNGIGLGRDTGEHRPQIAPRPEQECEGLAGF